jgi:hypothetical protein
MHVHPVRQFRLSPRERGRGVACDAEGAFIDDIPLLKRITKNGKEKWAPRACEAISTDLSKRYGLPIDASSKAQGIATIASALNKGEIARAQLATLFLRFPEPPPLKKSTSSRGDWVRFIGGLAESDLIKARWDIRWPAHAPDSQGGRYAPGSAASGERPGIGHNGGPPLEPEEIAPETDAAAGLGVIAGLAGAALLGSTVPAGSTENADIENIEGHQLEQIHGHHPWPKYLGGPMEQALTKLPRSLHLKYHAELDADPELSRRRGTDYFRNLSPADRADVLRRVLEFTKRFDAENGTHLYDDMVKNGFPVTP